MSTQATVESCASLEQAYERYIGSSLAYEAASQLDAAWANLEAAHVLGQRITKLHVRAHVAMLGLAWRTRDRREVIGQLMRIVAATLVTWIWVPRGNTGGSNVSAWRSMPIPEDLRELPAQHDPDHKPR